MTGFLLFFLPVWNAPPTDNLLKAIFSATLRWHQGDFPLTVAFDAASRLVSTTYAVTLTNFVFDAAGNELSETSVTGAKTFSYDGENRLLTTATAIGVYKNTYQGDGLRRTRQEPGKAVVTYIWTGSSYLGEI